MSSGWEILVVVVALVGGIWLIHKAFDVIQEPVRNEGIWVVIPILITIIILCWRHDDFLGQTIEAIIQKNPVKGGGMVPGR